MDSFGWFFIGFSAAIVVCFFVQGWRKKPEEQPQERDPADWWKSDDYDPSQK